VARQTWFKVRKALAAQAALPVKSLPIPTPFSRSILTPS
jgi:hypothetical protein